MTSGRRFRTSRRTFLQTSAGLALALGSTGGVRTAEAEPSASDSPTPSSGSGSAPASDSSPASSPSVSPSATSPSSGQAPLSSVPAGAGSFLWVPNPSRPTDLYAAFRGTFSLGRDTEITFHLFGAHWFHAWLDGAFLTEGPARFETAHPEYEVLRVKTAAGRHCLSALVHNVGVSTRMLRGDLIPPFLMARVFDGDAEIPVAWKCREMTAFRATNVRINPQLDWIEWCDLRVLPRGWKDTSFDETGWVSPAAASPGLGELHPLSIGAVRLLPSRPALLAQGRYAGPTVLHTGTAGEDLHEGILKRDLNASAARHDGVWRRYDLGQVRLFRPRFRLRAPAGAQVEFLYAETLSRGAVSPLIPLSCGSSCNLDHFTASGGEEEFAPMTPKGGRYLEVHVSGPEDQIRFLEEEILERSYFDQPAGSFTCEDGLLNRVWQLGVATLRGCTEDAVVDNPTRERGQWTGDVVTVGMDIMAAAHNDLRLIRRGLRQSAWCARPDGVIAGLCPGGTTYLSSYALQWIPAVLHYHRLTGDRALLEEMFPCAEKNLAAFQAHRQAGLVGQVPGTWTFIDWGYVPPAEGPDLALNLHYLLALRGMRQWAQAVRPDQCDSYTRLAEETSAALRPRFESVRDTEGFNRLGYHATALAFHAGLWSRDQERPALEALKRHMRNCFPNNPEAPRLSNPAVQSRQLITPYFAHYAFPPLIERGEMDFVLGQYRTCWGYALEEGRTTMIEVFDPNWSHCHQWACCPTWQLSRYVLGLHPRFDLGRNHYQVRLEPGSLRGAQGVVPIIGGDKGIEVRWTRQGEGDRAAIAWEVTAPEPITLHLGPEAVEVVEGRGSWRKVWGGRA